MKQYANIKKEFPQCQENVVLREFTTMGVGGVADLFYVAKDIFSLTKILELTTVQQVPYLVIGWGSNIIVSDNGFPGLVIRNETSNIVRIPDSSQLLIDSGTTMAKLISETASQQLTGVEFLAGIPGTVGGACYGNAGVRGVSIGDFVKELTIFHPPKNTLEKARILTHNREWMEYSYRSSKLKKLYVNKSLNMSRPVILTIKLGLAPAKKEDILERIRQSAGFRSGAMDPAGWQHGTQPKGVKSSGCIFRNPGNSPEEAAGYLLDRAGMKRKKIGDAQVSAEHANFVVNRGRATAQDIRELIEKMRQTVNEKYNIHLEEEVEYVGKW